MLRQIRVTILQSSLPQPQILVFLSAPSGKVYYSVRLTAKTNYTAFPDFTIPGDTKPFKLSFISYEEPRDLRGLVDISVEEL